MNTPFKQNIPVIMGLLGVWNMSFMGYNARTTLPYAEALLKLPAHIQQLDMEVSVCLLTLPSYFQNNFWKQNALTLLLFILLLHSLTERKLQDQET